MSAFGWLGWLVTGGGIAALDLLLLHFKHTSLSDTWLAGAHNKLLRPLEAATFLALGSHLFYGTTIWAVLGSALALGGAVVYTSRRPASKAGPGQRPAPPL